jgi:outer membrane protein OmpA-like peptidoglycan-associated protein
LLLGRVNAQSVEQPVSETVRQLTQVADNLDREAQPANYADLERMRARQAIAQIAEVRTRDRPDAIDNAQVLLRIADFSIKTQLLQTQLVQLDRERDAIYVQASKRDAELARKEAEQLRLKVLAYEEEQAILTANSEQPIDPALNTKDASGVQTQRVADARAKEASLARLEEEITAQMSADPNTVLKMKTVAGKNQYLLMGFAFEPGKSQLTASAKSSLLILAQRVKASSKNFIFKAYSDSAGNEQDNIKMTKQRAEAVAAVFLSAGIIASRLKIEGLGSSNPIASNKTQAGRAQNRRVEIY